MANSIEITRTVFQSIETDGNVTDTSYGIRVYDDYEAHYSNMVSDLDALKALSAEQIVDLAANINDGSADMIQFARENGAPIYVDGDRFEFASGNTPKA